MKYFEVAYRNGDKKMGMIFDTDLYLEEVDFKVLCDRFRRYILEPKELEKKKEVSKLEKLMGKR